METGILVEKTFAACLTGFLLISVMNVEPAYAAERQEIRFYKINKDEITQRLRFTTKKSRQAGCHNFLKRARLHKAVQFAYKRCRVFAKKDCAEESLMQFYRDKEPEPTTDLTEGFGWLPVGEHKRGELVRSWHCE